MRSRKYTNALAAVQEILHYTDAALSDALVLAEHLKRADMPRQAREDIECIIDNLLRTAKLTSNVAGLSCGIYDNKSLPRENFDVYDALRHPVRVWCNYMFGGSLVFTEDGGRTRRYIPFFHRGKPYFGYGEYGVKAVGSRDATEAVFSSLFSNAAKYAKSRASLEIEQDEGFVVCSVTNDVDRQIPEDYKAAIFHVGIRVPGTGKPGTGLGLATAKRFAELQGGRLWLETEGDEVSFRFTIPASNKQ
ncbi:MAG: HAMP domain-containing histidine kinase [Candidatus Aenigmarchaeota archaeon]|nr:HAMP domain-containing histidine kinase [Candidatus Aenigmarchaeota archaeon]